MVSVGGCWSLAPGSRLWTLEFRLLTPDPWGLGGPAAAPSPALAGTLSPSDGERDGVRGSGAARLWTGTVFRLPVCSSTATPNGSSQLVKFAKCCSARTSVGAMSATL